MDGNDTLQRELEMQRIRTQVAIELAPMVARHFGSYDEDPAIVAVVEDIVDRWVATDPNGYYRPVLFGRSGFIATYVGEVERAPDGGPHWQFRGKATDDPYDYAVCVWSYHVGRLMRTRRAAPQTILVTPEDSARMLSLWSALETERARTSVAVELSPLVWEPLRKTRHRVAELVDAVVSAWQRRSPDDPVELTGLDGFTDTYYKRIHFKHPETEALWEQFIPPDESDEKTYAINVWRHHLNELKKP